MLVEAVRRAEESRVPFTGVLGQAEVLPFEEGSFSVVFSTNAIHHFDLREHLREVARVLRPGGYYLIYSRLRDQNARSIWGRLFPKFADKETRLYDAEDFEGLDGEVPELILDSLEELTFDKPFSPEHLLRVAKKRKYSTFAFYGEAEFHRAYEKFRSRVRHWRDGSYRSETAQIIFRRN